MRDLYAVGEFLLLVATDRISAFDHVLATGIPGKGKVLTQLSLFWFDFLKDIVPNHLITADVSQYPSELRQYTDELDGRSMLVKRAQMFPVECVVRGYLSGSGWKDYLAYRARSAAFLCRQDCAKPTSCPSPFLLRPPRAWMASTMSISPLTRWSRVSAHRAPSDCAI